MWLDSGFVRTCGLLALAAASASGTAISREIARVRADAQTTVAGEQMAGVVARLDRAAAADGAGRPLLALYELQPAYETQAAFAFSSAAGVKTLEQFADRWKAAGEPAPAAPDGRRRPLFVEALAQSAEGKAVATYHASLPYAEDAGLFGGLFYLGESQAFGKFADFCRSLDIPAPGRAPVLRPLAAELAAFEAGVLDAYNMAEGAARQPFINISVTLKLAKSLDQAGRRPGALLQYLLARYRFALTRTNPPAAGPQQRLAAARAFPSAVDSSIAEFFMQLADAGAGAADASRIAAAVADDVLPAYRRMVS